MASRHKNDYALIAKSGLVSGVIGTTVPFPFNLVRCLQQTQPSVSRSVFQAMKDVVSVRGVPGLYRSIGAAWALYTPATAVFYATYFKGNEVIFKMTGNEHVSTFAAGIVANISANVLWTPMDNIIQRVWIAEGQATALTAIKHIYQRHGLGGFWRAYATSLAVWSPLSGIFFVLYESLMLRVEKSKIFEGNSHVGVLGASAISAAIAVMCTNPIDVCRTRYQVSDDKSLLQVVRQSLKIDRFGLFTIGLRARLLAVVPDMTVGITVFEVSWFPNCCCTFAC